MSDKDDGPVSFADTEPPPGPDPRIGLTLAGKYLIEEQIGEGGMGRVYRATHLELGEPVAVKFLLGFWATVPELRTRFRREAVALARLRHPGIVSVIDFGEHEGELFMVMELVTGVSLASQLSAGGAPISFIRVGPIFDQLLMVLEEAHAHGIVHRDVKPENVMLVTALDRADRVKVLDFGLVHLGETGGERLTETGTVRGTPAYMSPEQCKGLDVGPATDIYAVGIMLYEAITGALPFEADDAAALMAQHLFVEPPPLSERGAKPNVSAGLEAVVRSALVKKPEHRPTAVEFRDALAAALKGTDPQSMVERGAAERSRLAALSRGERALTGRPGANKDERDARETDAPHEPPRVLVWMKDDRRAAVVRNVLAVNGVSALVCSRSELREADAVSAIGVVIVGACEHNAERTSRVRAHAQLGALPILVVDAAGDETVALIRAGASDVSLAADGDADLVKKARRLMRRGR